MRDNTKDIELFLKQILDEELCAEIKNTLSLNPNISDILKKYQEQIDWEYLIVNYK